MTGPVSEGAHRQEVGSRGPRRARTLSGALGVTALGGVLPGAGHLWARRYVTGTLVLLLAVALAGVTAWRFRDLDALVDFVFDPDQLRVAAVGLGSVFVLWALLVGSTYAAVRPLGLSRGRGVLGAASVGLLCLAVAAPLALTVRYSMVQADLVAELFQDNETATAPVDATKENPWGDRRRVNVLLLGGDGSVTRDGVRTDSVIVLSMDTRSGDTVMFSLPRNMMNAQFPEGTPLHELYPDGFEVYGDEAASMLNAVYGQVPVYHPGVNGNSDNEGADAVKQAVGGSLGLRIDYYVLVNLNGFQQVVDAMGGVTVNINKPIPINGDTDRGIPPTGYLDPGPDQRLDGFEALWFARGRWGLSDYDRMLRQRCMVKAIIDEAQPLTLLQRYQQLAAAGKKIVRTDIPAQLMPAFVDLALQVKDADVRSIAFVSSSEFFPGDPDFTWVQERVQRALHGPRPSTPRPTPLEPEPGQPTPTETASPEPEPGEAVEVADSCAYRPES